MIAREATMATAQSPARSSRTLMRLFAVALLAGAAAGVYLAISFANQRQEAGRLFAPSFPATRLVTNEYAYHNPLAGDAVRSLEWQVTSGSLFARRGEGWTGVPDGRTPDAHSRRATDSAVFRLRTRLADFFDVSVSFRLRLDRFLTTTRTPPQSFDGVHVWLRYQSPARLYFVSVVRRDGKIVIGKKLLSGSRGRYRDLVSRTHRFTRGKWHDIQATISTEHGSVVIRLLVDGKLLARAIDDGAAGPVIDDPGRTGIRGDNAEFEFRDFQVRAV